QPDTPEIDVEVRAKVAELDEARHNVIWIPDMLQRAAVVQLMSHAAAFVCPSIYEPFGLINVEAIACETPVVASAVGGSPAIVVHGETGLLVGFEHDPSNYGFPADPRRFASDLASSIDAVVADPAAAERMGRAGRQRV